MSRRLLILAVLIVGMAYASVLLRNWPSQMDPTFVVSGATTAGPSLSSVSPTSLPRGSTVTVVATGSNFASTMTLGFINPSSPFILAGNIMVLSPTLMTADVTVPTDTPFGTVSTYASNGGGVISNYLSFYVTAGPSCRIQMNKLLYTNGDQVIVQSLHVTNQYGPAQQINYRLWLDIPGFPPAVFMQGGADGSVVLNYGADLELGPISLFPVSEPLPRGTYAFGCRFVDTVRGNVLAENVQPFFLQ
jgi:hypothetical protein